MSHQVELRNLSECDIDAAADICARAFVDSPCYVDIYFGGGDDNWRLGELKWLYATHFRAVFTKAPSALKGGYDINDALVCFFMFVPSNMPEITLWDKLCAGFFALPFRVGWGIYTRVVTTGQYFDDIVKDIIPNGECYDVLRMAVRPDCQGRGYGSKCLGETSLHPCEPR